MSAAIQSLLTVSPMLSPIDTDCFVDEQFDQWAALRSAKTYTQQWETFNSLVGCIFADRPTATKATLRGLFSKLVDTLRSTDILTCAFFAQYFLELCASHSDDASTVPSDRELAMLTRAVSFVCNWHKLLENLYYLGQESAQTSEPIFMSRGEYNLMVAKAVVVAGMYTMQNECGATNPVQTRMEVLVGALTLAARSAVTSLLFGSEVSGAALRDWTNGQHSGGLVPDCVVEGSSSLDVWRRMLLLFSADVCVAEAARLLSGLTLVGATAGDYTINVEIDTVMLMHTPLAHAGSMALSIPGTLAVPKLECLLHTCFSQSQSQSQGAQDLAVTIEILLLPRPGPCLAPALARFIASYCVPTCYILPVTDVVLVSWGSKRLLSSGHIGPLASSTGILLALLPRLHSDDLATIPPLDSAKGPLLRGVPLSILFSQAVSLYLDIGDRSLRDLGLRVAVAFSVLIGHPLTFAELQTAPAMPTPPAEQTGTPREKGKSLESFRRKLGLVEMSDSSDCDSDSDSSDCDCHSECDGDVTDASPVPPKVKPFVTTYLRVCLEMLQAQESVPETHYKHHAALLSIPAIVARGPVDINDLCVPLLLELIRLGNEFAIGDFNELKGAAVHALLFRYPRLALPALAHQIQSGALTLGGKVELLCSISKAAYALAGLSHWYDAEYIRQTMDSQGPTVPTTSCSGGSGDQPMDSASVWPGARGRGAATIIRRPRTLELLSGAPSRVRVFRNDFVDLLELFLTPIMGSLHAAELEAGLLLQRQKEASEADRGARHAPRVGPTRGLIQVVSGGEEKPGTDTWCSTHGVLDLSTPIVAVLSGNAAESAADRVRPPLTEFQVHSTRLPEGLNTLLPSHCLIALSGLVHCCVNSTRQRALIQQTLLLCDYYKDAESLALRRACLLALHTSIESWKYMKLNSHRYKSRNSGGAGGHSFGTAVLRDLCDVMHTREYFEEEEKSHRICVNDEDLAICSIVEWCALSLPSETDLQCRAMKGEVIRLVQEVW